MCFQVRYVCTMKGCEYRNLGVHDNEPKTAGSRAPPESASELKEVDEVLVISRHTKTVRAIEMRSGAEK